MPRIIGHRGAAGLAPENTLRSFRTALEYDVDAVEFDVRRTADGVLVALHDATLDRTTDASGPLDEWTYSALSSVDAGNGTSIPTIDDVLDCLAPTDVALQIELKEPEAADGLLERLAEYELRDRVVLTSFDPGTITTVADTATERAYLTKSVGRDALDRARSLGVEYVCTGVRHATAPTVQAAHDEGLQIGFWGVNAPAEIRAVLGTDADVLSTDRPDRVARILEEARYLDLRGRAPAAGRLQVPRPVHVDEAAGLFECVGVLVATRLAEASEVLWQEVVVGPGGVERAALQENLPERVRLAAGCVGVAARPVGGGLHHAVVVPGVEQSEAAADRLRPFRGEVCRLVGVVGEVEEHDAGEVHERVVVGPDEEPVVPADGALGGPRGLAKDEGVPAAGHAVRH